MNPGGTRRVDSDEEEGTEIEVTLTMLQQLSALLGLRQRSTDSKSHCIFERKKPLENQKQLEF